MGKAKKLDKAGEVSALLQSVSQGDRYDSPFFCLFRLIENLEQLRTHSVSCRDFFHGKSNKITDECHWYGSLSFYIGLKCGIGNDMMQLSNGLPVRDARDRKDRDKLLRAIELSADIAQEELFLNYPDGSVIQFFDSFRFFIRMIRLWQTPQRKFPPFGFGYRFVDHCRNVLEHRLWKFESALKERYERGEEMDFLTNSLYDLRRSVEEVSGSSEHKLLEVKPPRDPLVRDIWLTVVHADGFYIALRRELGGFRDFFEGREYKYSNLLSQEISPRINPIGLCFESIKEMLDKAKRFKEPKLAAALASLNEDVMDYLDGVKRLAWGKDAKDPPALVGLREVILRFISSAEDIAMGKKPGDDGWEYLLQSAYQQFSRLSDAVARVERKIDAEKAAKSREIVDLLRRVNNRGDQIYTSVNRMEKRSRKKNEKHNLKIGVVSLQWIAKRWQYEKSHPEFYPDVRGRQISKADVFSRIPGALAQRGITSAKDLAKAIANARRQHPEWFGGGNKGSAKKKSRG